MIKLALGKDYHVTFNDENGITYIWFATIHHAFPLRAFFVELANIKLAANCHGMPVRVYKIVNRHLNGDRDILMCQDELIEAGYLEWARL